MRKEVFSYGDEMDCEKVNYLISDFLDNELNDSQAKFVVRHLEQCQKCCRELNYLKKIKSILSHKRDAQPLPFFETRLFNRINNHGKTVSLMESFAALGKTALITAGSLLIFCAGIFVTEALTGSNTQNKVTVDDLLIEDAPSNTIEKKMFTECDLSDRDVIQLAVYYK